MLQPSQIDPGVPCPYCRATVSVSASAFDPYFLGNPHSCQSCQKALDWWQAVLGWVRSNFAFGSSLALAGASTTIFQTKLAPNKAARLDLTAHGIPQNAEILYLNLTSNGSAVPLLLHGNDPLRELVPSGVSLYGMAVPDQPGDGDLSVYVVWFVRKQEDTIVRHLVEAARHYEAKRFDAVIVPANIAVEASVTPVAAHALQSFASKGNLDNFLQDAATYSHQLHVLLPIIAFLCGIPELPDHIRILLNRLRKLRNKIAHEGTCHKQSPKDAAEHLTAALFGLNYANLLLRKIDEARTSGRLPRQSNTPPN